MFKTWLPFEWIVAIRFLRKGRLQTLLIVVGVALGVASRAITVTSTRACADTTLTIAGIFDLGNKAANERITAATGVEADSWIKTNAELFTAIAAQNTSNNAIRAETLIADVGLTKWKDNGAGQLSGGQQQRVAIARALAMGPALLLADEPTGNLDTKSADEVFALLRRFNSEHGTTVLFVTHNVAMAARRDRTIEVIDGQVSGQLTAQASGG